MSVTLEVSIRREEPLKDGERYPSSTTLAQLELEVPDTIGWSLYRYVVEQVSDAEFKTKPPVKS